MSVFSSPSFDDHEKVCFASDRSTGLRAIIAVHSSTLGAAVGGCRMYPYEDDARALEDVLRLSRGMTYKSALAGLPFGGGKSVIIGDPRRDKTPELLRAMGAFVDSFGGLYVAAEDSGTSVDDLRCMASRTRHVSGIGVTEHGGDPSPSTARGVFVAIGRALEHRLGSADLRGVRVAVQGLGHVGYYLASYLTDAGAAVYGADVNEANVERAVAELGVNATAVEDILGLDVDVFSPCALGGVLNAQSIASMRAGVVAGAANNQLASPEDGDRLLDQGILYCPDFLINAGGIIDVHYQRSGDNRELLNSHLNAIGDRLAEVLERADSLQQPTQRIAEALAREILDRAALPELRLAQGL